jgi:predicted nucleic acid-binding Zn ribbon protein
MQRKLYLESMQVVLDPELRMAIEVFPCEDGHTQEPSLCESVLQTVKADQLWIADRNMCTQGFLFGISTASSDFLIREHKTLPQQAISELQFQGDVETGGVE